MTGRRGQTINKIPAMTELTLCDPASERRATADATRSLPNSVTVSASHQRVENRDSRYAQPVKSAYGSLLSSTVETGLFKNGAVDSRPTLWGIAGYSDAPCANRTHNLMIKSHKHGLSATRTGSVQPAFEAIGLVELVPPTHPKRARRFHGSIPELGGAP